MREELTDSIFSQRLHYISTAQIQPTFPFPYSLSKASIFSPGKRIRSFQTSFCRFSPTNSGNYRAFGHVAIGRWKTRLWLWGEIAVRDTGVIFFFVWGKIVGFYGWFVMVFLGRVCRDRCVDRILLGGVGEGKANRVKYIVIYVPSAIKGGKERCCPGEEGRWWRKIGRFCCCSSSQRRCWRAFPS